MVRREKEKIQSVTINGILYEFRCTYIHIEKAIKKYCPAFKIELQIFQDGEVLEWEDFKHSYAGEKIGEYIKNTINGKRSF